MKRINILVLLLSVLLIGSCSKNDPYQYEGEHIALNIWLGTSAVVSDSVTYNFAYTVARHDSITFFYRLMGYPVDYDRTFELEAYEGDMTGVYYSFGEYVVKAGEYEGTFPIYIDKPEGWEEFVDEDGYILFRMKENTHFKPGVQERSQLHIIFKNYVAKPDNWDTAVYPYMALSGYFGTYSDVKYSFVIQTTEMSNFRVYYTTAVDPELEENVITSLEATYLKAKCKAALAEYNEANGPLLDENGNEVTF